MKPSNIMKIMDIALEARRVRKTWNPAFRGDAGLGKSEIVQQWVAQQKLRNPNFGFIDLRMAYLESPDLIGLPREVEHDDRWRTIHALPGFWPTDPNSEGVLLLEEFNRAPTSVTNALMQILTDRKILSDDPARPDDMLPDGWIIAGCVNPDTAKYDVQPMDQALSDRFVFFDVEYDNNTFMRYIEEAGWHKNVIMFLKSNIWVYKKPENIGKDGKYISPRTWSQMNAAEMAGASNDLSIHRTIANAILGKHIGKEYWTLIHNDRPVLVSDILTDPDKAFSKLRDQSKNGQYAGDKIAMTVDDIINNYSGWFEGCGAENDPAKIDEATMVKVAKIIPSDQAVVMLQGCIMNNTSSVVKGRAETLLADFAKRNPECIQILKHNVKLRQSIKPS